jgi:hypothetical protein
MRAVMFGIALLLFVEIYIDRPLSVQKTDVQCCNQARFGLALDWKESRPEVAPQLGAACDRLQARPAMFGFERRWARDALSAFAPEQGPGLAPSVGEVDYDAVLQRMLREVAPLARIGLRLAVWSAALAPMWLLGKFATISSLGSSHRPALLSALLTHRVFAVRELATLLKLCAAMALLGVPSVRARSGYDDARSAQPQSGVRIRLTKAREEQPPLRVWPAQDGALTEVELERERTQAAS